jgi:GntR family transcriptional regulator
VILDVSDLSAEPLHHQITRQVRALILAGELAEGDALPSIRALARQEKVSVITVQRAYDDLERETLIQARRGKGFFVTGIPEERKTAMAQQRLRKSLAGALDAARAEGLNDGDIREVFRGLLGESVEGSRSTGKDDRQ